MADLARVEDLEAMLPLASKAALRSALRRAGDAFVGAVGWPVLLHQRSWVGHGDGGRALFLPARHVTEASVSIDGAEAVVAGAPGSGIRLDGGLGLLVRDEGWPRGLANLTVEFTAGWSHDSLPGDISDAVLERAAMSVSSPAGMTQITAGPFSGTIGMGGATQAWSEVVHRYAVGVGDRA